MSKATTLTRYLAGIVALFAVLLLSGSVFSLWTLNATIQKSFTELNSLSALLVSSRLEQFFFTVRGSISHVSRLVQKPDIYPRTQLAVYLADIVQEHAVLDTIEIVGQDGRVVAVSPSDPSRIGISRTGEKVYEAVKASGDFYWSDSYISLQDNQPAITCGLHAGTYTILANLNLRWFGDFAASIRAGSDQNVEIRLTDRNGVLIHHPDMNRVLRRERQADFTRIKDGIDAVHPVHLTEEMHSWLVAARKLGEPAWYILVLYPRDRFNASLRWSLLSLLGLSLVSMIVGIMSWQFRLHRITRAFTAISIEAKRISRGDYGQLESFGEGFYEFERIGDSLNTMVRAIGVRESTLRDREQGFRDILESIELAAITLDNDGIIKYVNPYLERLIDLPSREIVGKSFKAYLCGGSDHCPFELILGGDSPSTMERSSIRIQGGEERIIDWSIVRNLDASGMLSGATGIGHDTTEMVRARESVEKSLHEKDILLREVHHRVKNNLQVITSLLSLQQADTENQMVLGALVDASSRIQSIALVHELLYDSDDFGDLDFRKYAESLTGHLLATQLEPPLRYKFNFDQLRLSLTEAVPCGLILNEAITNSIKHAFQPVPDSAPCIEISGSVREDGMTRIEIRDNGCGMGESIDAAGGSHLGLTIMGGLADQLHGSIRFYNDGGAVVELVFRSSIGTL